MNKIINIVSHIANKVKYNWSGLLLVFLICNISCFAASLGFEAPNKIFSSGELFTNKIVINYSTEDSALTGIYLNVEWSSETVEIRTALWNTTDFVLNEYEFYNTYSNLYTNVFFYSSGQPLPSAWHSNTNLTLVELVCVIVGREICDFEFNSSSNALPFPSTATDGSGKDILGDPGVLYDGFDVLPIITRSTAGYKLSAGLSADNVAVIRDKTNIVLDLLVKKFGNPLPYEHIRATLDYDESVTECRSNAFDYASWLTDIQFTIEKTNVITTSSLGVTTNLEPAGTLIFEAKCPLTNFTGNLATFNFKPIDYEESLFEFNEYETFLSRNEVNLLGIVDEEDDGLEDSIVYVLPSGNLRYIIKLQKSIEEKYSESKAALYITSDTEDYFDDIECYLYFDSNMIAFSDDEDYSFKLHPDFTNNASSQFYTDNITNVNHLYNQTFCAGVNFDNVITNKENTLIEIGEITWTNTGYGNASFFFNVNDSYIEFDGRDLINNEKQLTEFPVSMQVVEFGESTSNAFSIAITPTDSTNYVVHPGKTIDLNIFGICQNSITGFGKAIWRYDSEIFRAISFPPNMWTNTIILESGSITSDIFGIDGEFSTSGSGETADFAMISFQAVESKELYLEPLGNHSQITNIIGQDILGSAYLTNDGIFGFTIVSKEPDEIFMRLKAEKDLFAGKFSEFILELLNPLSSSWTSLRAEIEIDEEELVITNENWSVKINQVFPIVNVDNNVIGKFTNVYQKLIVTPSNSYTKVFTSVTTRAILQLSSATPVNISELEILASFSGMPIEEEITYDFHIDSSTGFYDLTYVKSTDQNILSEDLLSENTILDETEWLVSPSGIKVWINADTDSRSVLQTERDMFIYIDNPHYIPYDHVTLAWSYDADNFEIVSAEALDNFTGEIWFNNHNEGEGYLCADLSLPSFTTNSEIEVLKFRILPKLTDTLELELNEIEITRTNEVASGVWQGNYNLLETIDEDVYDNCQEWKRGTELTRNPLLQLWDIDDLEADDTILDLKDSGTGLEVYETGINYKWWTIGNDNIKIEFDSKSMMARIIGKDNWTGQEIFWVYCQNMDNGFISKDSIKIDVHKSNYDWNEFAVNIERDDYFTVTGILFTNLSFNIVNPPVSNELIDVNAFIIENGNTNSVTVIKNNGSGNIEWQTPATPGMYPGTIIATDTTYTNETTSSKFSVLVLDSYSNKDADGDEFEVKYNNTVLTLPDPTRVHITGGTDTDKIKIKVRQNKITGDGVVDFDEIISDSGLNSVSLQGSVNLIQTDGPIGSVKVKRGIVGQITAKRGGVKAVKISTKWNKYDEEFYEVGLLKGVSAQGDIGIVKVSGGNIGDESEPAIISSANGSINMVITKMKKKIYWDGPNIWDDIWIEIAGDEGANIFANIYAPNGEIGSVIAVGGKVGSLTDDAATEICSGNNIQKISAVAKKGDEEMIGGFVHSDITANGIIDNITSKGGDICGSTDSMDYDGEFDELELIEYPVVIYADEVKNISAKGKKYGFRAGPTPDDAWKEIHGGNISSYIVLRNTIGKISSKAGNMSIYLETKEDIKNIKAKSSKFKEYYDSNKVIVGGQMIFSVIMPNTKYRSTAASDYKNIVNSLKISGVITGSWIGVNGSFNPKKFKFGSLIDTEIWVDGNKASPIPATK